MEAAADDGTEATALMPHGNENENRRHVRLTTGHTSAAVSPRDSDSSEEEAKEESFLRAEDVISGGNAAKELEFRFSFTVDGKGVLSGVAASGVGVGAEASKRGGGDSAGATGASWWQRPKLLVAVGSLVVLLAGVATIVALLWPKSGQRLNIPTDPPPDPELLLEDGRQIIRRSKWSDVPPDFRRRLHHPTPYVIIAHTAGTACRGELECFPLLCTYRDEHRAKWEQPDISYNFLIDVEGNVYEGRGWNATNNFQSWATRCNLAVAFMGNFMNDKVTLAMATSLERLLKLGVALSKLDKNYRLLAHDQVLATLSPGRNVLDLIKDWPHRCLSSCSEGVQCIQEDTTEVSPVLSGSIKSGKR